jgi:hypothetical protein
MNEDIGVCHDFDPTDGICRVSFVFNDGSRRTLPVPQVMLHIVDGVPSLAGVTMDNHHGDDDDGSAGGDEPASIADHAVAAKWLLYELSRSDFTYKSEQGDIEDCVSSRVVRDWLNSFRRISSLHLLVKAIVGSVQTFDAPDSSPPPRMALKQLTDVLLCVSAEHDDNEAVSTLLGAGADVNGVDDELRTALWFAAANGNVLLADRLIQRGAAFNRVDRDMISPLGAACQEGHVRCAEMLLRVRANANGLFNGKAQNTPLMLACFSGQAACVELLLKHDASVTRKVPNVRRWRFESSRTSPGAVHGGTALSLSRPCLPAGKGRPGHRSRLCGGSRRARP